jgi:glyoxylase-like metal-dependent hydrolase (beta-lactamase superfamily II)
MPANEAKDAWTAPGAHEVAPGVYRIPLPMPNDGLRAINVYALTDPGSQTCTLVDAGWAIEEARVALESALGSIGHDLGTIERFLVTHQHRDHYTLGIVVRRLLGTKVAIGVEERPNIETAVQMVSSSALEQQLASWGASELAEEWNRLYSDEDRQSTASFFEYPDEWLDGGTRLTVGSRTITAIHTPGHTRGHLVFHDEAARVLFTGDHVLPHITPSIGFEPARRPNPLGDFLNSLRLLLTQPDALLLPGHGPAAESVHHRVHELLAHHETRLDQTLAAVRTGADTAFEVAGRIGWTRRNTPFDKLDVFNKLLATGETSAHLVVLAERGLITRTVDADGLAHHAAE